MKEKKGLFLTVICTLLFALLGVGGVVYAAESGFITTDGTQFVLDSKPFFVAGTNNHYIHYAPKEEVDRVLAAAQAMKLNVIRIWGFIDIGSPDENGVATTWSKYGPTAYDLNTNGVYFQYWDNKNFKPAYNDGPNGLEHLDYVLAKANEMGIKLIITLTNNWLHLGGIPQYMAWYFLNDQYQFFTNDNVKQAYKDWVSHVITRVNSITGVAYKDDPTIFAWELINEPHVDGASPHILTDWTAEMSAFIKEIDPNHMVALGDEGQFNWEDSTDRMYNGKAGVDFEAILQLPTIDFGSYHLYPDWWEKTPEWGVQWIKDHIAAGNAVGKPVVLGEFGWKDDATKEQVYQQWVTTIKEENGGGWLFWRLVAPLASGAYPNDTERFDVRYPSPVATLLSNAARELSNSESVAEEEDEYSLPGEFSMLRPASGEKKVSVNPTFTWEEAGGALNYAVVVGTDSQFTSPLIAEVVWETSYKPEISLAYGTTYYWKVMALNDVGTTEAANAVSSFVTEDIPEANIIDDFEQYMGWNQALQSVYKRNEAGNQIKVSLNKEYVNDGKYSLKYDYTVDNPEWTGVQTTKIKNRNWQGADGIQFWLKPDGSKCSMTIQFQESSGEYWEAFVPLDDSTEARLVQLPFEHFNRPGWYKGGNGKRELDSIASFAIYIGKAQGEPGSGTLYIDSITLMGNVTGK